MSALWVVVSCNLVEVYRGFRDTCPGPCDEARKHIWNFGKLPDNTVEQPGIQPFSEKFSVMKVPRQCPLVLPVKLVEKKVKR
jgi:hypothetical protein